MRRRPTVRAALRREADGRVKLFHAISLEADVNSAKVLAFSFPHLRVGIQRIEQVRAELTAIVEDDLDRDDEGIGFALATLKAQDIAVASLADMSGSPNGRGWSCGCKRWKSNECSRRLPKGSFLFEETDEHTGQFARRGAPMVDVPPGATTESVAGSRAGGSGGGRLRGGPAADGSAAFDL